MDEWLLLDQWMVSPHPECCRLSDVQRIPGIREILAALGHENYGFWRQHGQSFDESAENYKKMRKNQLDWGQPLPPVEIPVRRDVLLPYPRHGEKLLNYREVEKMLEEDEEEEEFKPPSPKRTFVEKEAPKKVEPVIPKRALNLPPIDEAPEMNMEWDPKTQQLQYVEPVDTQKIVQEEERCTTYSLSKHYRFLKMSEDDILDIPKFHNMTLTSRTKLLAWIYTKHGIRTRVPVSKGRNPS